LLVRLLLIIVMALLAGCNGAPTSNSGGALNAIVIEATGSNYHWYFRYPGLDGVLGTNDDQHSTQNLYLPDNAQVTIKLKSEDYLYSFALPALELKQIAVPELDFDLQFATDKETTMTLLGDQFCGFSHKTLLGKVHIINQDTDFYRWADDPNTTLIDIASQ